MESLLPFQIGAAALENLGLAIMIGTLACRQFFGASVLAGVELIQKRMSHLFTASIIATLIANLFAFWFAVAAMADVTLREALPMLGSATTSTQIGQASLIGIAILGLLLGASRVLRVNPPHRLSSIFLWVAIFAFMLSRSATSHAAAAGNASVAIPIDALHFFATSLWLGMVIVATFIVLPMQMKLNEGRRLVEVVPFALFLSRMATGALLVVLLTGAYKGWSSLHALSEFVSTGYGNILGVKLALVALAIALGAVNRFFILPALHPIVAMANHAVLEAQRSFKRILIIESCVLLLILLAASLLSFTSPAGG